MFIVHSKIPKLKFHIKMAFLHKDEQEELKTNVFNMGIFLCKVR